MYRIITVSICGVDTIHRLKFNRTQKLRSLSVLKPIYEYLFHFNCSTLSSNFYVAIIFSNLLLKRPVFKCGIIIIFYGRIHIILHFFIFNPLNPELNPICYLLALLGAHHLLHVSRIRVKSLTLRRLMSYIYGAPILDVSRSHTTTQHSR